MEQEHFYEVLVAWDKDRKGTMSSPVLDNVIEVATPPQFPKGMEGIWSPEHLLVGAVNSCLMTTFLAIAENSRLEFSGFSSRAAGKLEKSNGKWMISEITLMPVVTVLKEADKEKAEKVLQKSEQGCLISNSVKSKIIFEPEVIISAGVR